MRKLGVFVEGQTEQLFVQKLVKLLVGAKGLKIIVEKKIGSTYILIQTDARETDEIQVLIVDCANDAQVKSAILDRRDGLIAQGYSKVIGLRDLYPLAKSELATLKAGLMKYVPTKDLPIVFVVANGEVEAWFVQEGEHYPMIDPALNRQVVLSAMGFNTESDSAEVIEHPAKFLDSCYRLVGKRYTKRRANALRTIDALDYDNLYMNGIRNLPSFQDFIAHLEDFFFIAQPPTLSTVS